MKTRFINLSIRHRMLLLLAFTTAAALVAGFVWAQKLVLNRKQLLQQQALIASQQNLDDFDQGFDKKKRQALELFRSFQYFPEMATQTQNLSDYFHQLKIKRKIAWVEIRDRFNQLLISTHSKEAAGNVGIVGEAFSARGIARYLETPINQSQSQLSAAEIELHEFMEGPLGGWARIIESPDELHEISFGGYKLLFYWNFFSQPGFEPAIIICDQVIRNAVKEYLLEELPKRFAYNNGEFRLCAFDTEFKSLLGRPEVLSEEELSEFVQTIQKSGTFAAKTLEKSGQTWIMAGQPGKKLLNQIIISLYPVSVIEERVYKIKHDLFWSMIFAVLLASIVFQLFSRVITPPLTQLLQGVKALQNRQTDHRIQYTHNDELGRLAQSFNHSMTVIEDVLGARQIQQLLAISKAPEIPGYRVLINQKSTQNLTGDFCDVIQAEENIWALAIGNADADGASASLIVAMAKAILSQSINEKNFSLSETFKCLNSCLLSQFYGKKSIRLIIAILDLQTNKIVFSNAGLASPMLVRSGEICKEYGKAAPPMGISHENDLTIEEHHVELNPGDHLLLHALASNDLPEEVKYKNFTGNIEESAYRNRTAIILQRITDYKP